MPHALNSDDEQHGQHFNDKHNKEVNLHRHKGIARCLWESDEDYHRKWSFPAFSTIRQSIPHNYFPLPDEDKCIYEIIAWEKCALDPPWENPKDDHNGFCIVKLRNPCQRWDPDQLGPRVCCNYGMKFVEIERREGFCLGENCPGGVGRKDFPYLKYDIPFYHGHEPSEVDLETERIVLHDAEETLGKDVRFSWKNADGPGYEESFKKESRKFLVGFQGRRRAPMPVKSHYPNDSSWPLL